MKLSILISTKNREKILIQTINSIISESDFDKANYEIIITNDGEPFSEIDIANYQPYNINIVKNSGRGLAAGRNNGTKYAHGEVLLFYDDDILPTKNHFNRHVQLHDKYENVIITANRFYPDNLIQIAKKTPFGRYKLQYEYNWLEGLNLVPASVENQDVFYCETLAGFSCSMRKTTYDIIGGFNENFPAAGCEDSEFFYRASKNDIKLIFDQSNICYHNELDNFQLKQWLNRQASGIIGAIVICKLHPEGKEHPTYYLNTPIQKYDSNKIKRIKRKRTLLSFTLIKKLIFTCIYFGEKLKLSDLILFRLYNAAWLGATKHSFIKTYKKY